MPKWPPLECNPESINDFLKSVGVSEETVASDIMGLDPDLLSFVPQPSIAVIFLFPSKAKIVQENLPEPADKVFFIRQVPALDEACGTIAVIHAISNNLSKISLADGPLKNYIEQNDSATAEERGHRLDSDETIHESHQATALQGQTGLPSEGQSSDHHFVCFTQVGDRLYEIDGCKSSPIDHGPATPSILEASAKVIKEKYMRDPSILDFSMLSIGAAGEE
eukprot:TRINITY_DN920_c0_g1_i1.p1 TRINITY_DN920_c0_g1~~TRINITY_DN920_c0_g1_i1.p1  ORF type:complete len:236 (-),score=77.94 TRINITY_DN920_c0_g1_i1:121-786(-)